LLIEESKTWLQAMKLWKARLLRGEVIDQYELEHERQAFTHHSLDGLQTDQEKLCYWLNVYNGLTCYWLARKEIRTTVGEVSGFFQQASLWAGQMLTLDDIEHGILRRRGRPPFPNGDPRWQFCVSKVDYRIHFALNCGAASCPAIFGYSLEELSNQLTNAEVVFLDRHFHVDHEARHIRCLDLFQKYRDDFGPRFLNQFSDYRVSLLPFDWSLR